MPAKTWLSSFLWFILVFSTSIGADALQFPFARFYELGAAGLVPDCHIGLGDSCSVHDGSALCGCFRWGEARHPAPTDQGVRVSLGFSNPSGLRNKEDHLMDLGPGIWSCSESHLTKVTQSSCRRRLKLLAASSHRDLRIHFGAAVPTRSNSDWAGTWAGVLTLSDFPSQEILLPDTGGRACGRLLTTCHYIQGHSLMVSVCYGYPKGPTWPDAKNLNELLLDTLTREVVLGSSGPRAIGGDFNVSETQLFAFDTWRQKGWRSAQELAADWWDQDPQWTCKNATAPDMIWLSPEAVALRRQVMIIPNFAEHSTIAVSWEFPFQLSMIKSWPLPSRIPWQDVSEGWTSEVVMPQWRDDMPVDAQWGQLGAALESSLDGHLPSQPGGSLCPQQRGRLQRTQPLMRPESTHILRPSRPSEVKLRNDLIGGPVKLWFRQLRRLQSYVAAIGANKPTAAAVAYRLSLWESIKNASGFHGGFPVWWQHHRSWSAENAPLILPCAPPGLAIAEAVFTAFRTCFEHFESWHLRQRSKLLQKRHEGSMQGLFQDLRKAQAPSLDFLQETHDFQVLDVDESKTQICLDQEVSSHGISTWRSNDGPFAVDLTDQMVLHVPQETRCQTGDLVSQHVVHSDLDYLHSSVLDFWQRTWCATPSISSEVWQRITGFCKAYMKPIDFEVQPITLQQWTRTLKRFKPHAARGVDGISHYDLIHAPTAWTERLLALLNQIELGESVWPAALLFGVVQLLAKEPSASTISRFRPIVVYSIIYRTWSRIRARELLLQASRYIDSNAYGFVPGCEPAQVWTMIQSEVELVLAENRDFCGLSTDLVRAFNHIPREHTFFLASHLGVPMRVLQPWKSFLSNCKRAFRIRGSLGNETDSTCGLPEGDSLSVYGMVQLGMCWHAYMRAFCPTVQSFSYVDNLSLTATSIGDLAQAFMSLRAFFEMWQMTTDEGKTTCWATTTTMRNGLRVLGVKMVDHSRELGGVLSFTKRRFTGLQKIQLAKLEPKWHQLRHSWASTAQKLAALPIVFWAGGLHGTFGSCFGEGQYDKLRTAAMKALRLCTAGSNSSLRLSLSSTPTADPSYWRLLTTVRTFRRLVRKEPALALAWQRFSDLFDGRLFSGPLSQLYVALNQVHWVLAPPFVTDHDGFLHDLLGLDDAALEHLLYDAWLQHLAAQVAHRRSMVDLRGLDPALVQRQLKGRTALEMGRLGALMSGAFIGDHAHSKYDLTKDPLCPECGVPNDVLHRLRCPKYAAVRGNIDGWVSVHDRDTTALCSHLLPSRSPLAVDWKAYFMRVEDSSSIFFEEPGPGEQHVFSDGTCGGDKPYTFASWGCILGSGAVFAAGHLPGLVQSSDRAELMGALAALRWQKAFQVDMHLWMDCLCVAEGVSTLLAVGMPGNWANLDIWDEIAQHVQELGALRLHPHWIPSHLDSTLLSCPFEDWVSARNNQVDQMILSLNHDRGPDFQALLTKTMEHHNSTWMRMDQLCRFHFGVAELTGTSSTELTEDHSTEGLVSHFDFDIFDEHQPHLTSLYIPELLDLVTHLGWDSSVAPFAFIESLLSWLFALSVEDSPIRSLSFIEVSVALSHVVGFEFPFRTPEGQWEMCSLVQRFERPTLAHLVRVVKGTLTSLCRLIDGDSFLVSHLNKVSVGIHNPTPGLFIRITDDNFLKIRGETSDFTDRRPIKRACDLARPT